MRHLVRGAVLAALVAQAWCAVRLWDYESELGSAIAYYDERHRRRALDHIATAQAAWDSDAEVWSWEGDIATNLYKHPSEGGRSDGEAEAILRRAWRGYAGVVLRCPSDAWAWSGLGEVALERARRRDLKRTVDLAELDRRAQGILDAPHAIALAAARLALRIEPSGYQELDVLAKIYESTGELDRAQETYVQSARMMPAPSFHTWGTGNRMFRGLYDAILAGLKEGIEKAPQFDKAMLNLDVGRFARSQGDLDTALAYLAAARAAAKGDIFWTYHASSETAGVLEQLGRLPEAVEELKLAREKGYDRASVSQRLGLLESRLGRSEEACVDLRDALREIPRDVGLRIAAAQACEQAREYETTEQILKLGFASPTESLTLSRALLDFYRRLGRGRTAGNLARSWARDFPEQREFQQWAAEIGAGGL